MRFLPLAGLGCLIAALPVFADSPAANLAQLMQLNQASQQQLQRSQGLPGYLGAGPRLKQQRLQQQLNLQQQNEQRMLQEAQRRQLLLFNQRARSPVAPPLPHRLDGINLQRQFQLQQQYQLDRFSIQQGNRRR